MLLRTLLAFLPFVAVGCVTPVRPPPVDYHRTVVPRPISRESRLAIDKALREIELVLHED